MLLLLSLSLTNVIIFSTTIYLPREPKGWYVSYWIFRKELMPMVTYSDLFTFVIMLCAVITLVITTFRHKK